jgi:hypothetical protein
MEDKSVLYSPSDESVYPMEDKSVLYSPQY